MIRKRIYQVFLILAVPAFVFGTGLAQEKGKIVHDAELFGFFKHGHDSARPFIWYFNWSAQKAVSPSICNN